MARQEVDMTTNGYPKDFILAVNDLIDNWEGGYVDDPKDPGGETNYGISRRCHPNLDIAHLTRDKAIGIYFKEYWPQSEGITDSQLRAKVFNMGVLMGPRTAVELARGCDNVSEYRLICKRHYEGMVVKHPELGKYLKGWTRRALA